MKILVVDDDEHILRLYKDELSEEGYEVVLAANGKEAIELFHKEDPDLVTLDIRLPDIDGIQLLRQMKEKKPRLPIIMSTAYDYRDDFSIWASEAYIVKSSDLNELKATIKMLLRR
ncbi:MAG: response regulator [Nitrospirota bacterium]|nr:response regulator [Nitrospirota bacterium]